MSQIFGQDEVSLVDYYYKALSFLSKSDSSKFITDMENRWNFEHTFVRQFSTNPNPCFREYIANETHYALERQGWAWTGRAFVVDTQGSRLLTREEYETARQKTLRAFVDHAIAFLKTGRKGCDSISYDLDRNLRAKLSHSLSI